MHIRVVVTKSRQKKFRDHMSDLVENDTFPIIFLSRNNESQERVCERVKKSNILSS